MAYARSLQYWVEKQSPLRSQNLHPLVESVIELWEAVKEHITLNYLDIIQDLGVTDEESPSQGPQATILAMYYHHQRRNQSSGELPPTLLPLLPKEI